jgi:hypothetical protein
LPDWLWPAVAAGHHPCGCKKNHRIVPKLVDSGVPPLRRSFLQLVVIGVPRPISFARSAARSAVSSPPVDELAPLVALESPSAKRSLLQQQAASPSRSRSRVPSAVANAQAPRLPPRFPGIHYDTLPTDSPSTTYRHSPKIPPKPKLQSQHQKIIHGPLILNHLTTPKPSPDPLIPKLAALP